MSEQQQTPGEEMVVYLPRPQTTTLDLRSAAQLAVITTPAQARETGQFLRRIRTSVRQVKAKYKAIRKPFRDRFRDAMAESLEMEAADLAPLLEAEALVARPLEAWILADRERVRQESQRLLADAEQRATEDRQRQVTALQTAAATAPTAPQRRAYQSQARRVEQAPLIPAPVTQAVPEPERIDGVFVTERRTAHVFDFDLLLRAVAAGEVPRQALQVNQVFLDDQATRIGSELRYPGVQVVVDTSLTARGL